MKKDLREEHLVSLTLVTSLLGRICRYQLHVAVVTYCKQVFAADVVVIMHFGIFHGKQFLQQSQCVTVRIFTFSSWVRER